MGSSETVLPSAAFLEALKSVSAFQGPVNFAQFMEVALYHPVLGYYSQSKKRVGYSSGTDFFTATTSGQIFGELVAASCESLLNEPPKRI